jgi:copper chaperone CopZ
MRLELNIDGMASVHAKHGVFTALAGVPGVLRAEVELGRAALEVDDAADLATIEVQLREATDLVGYQVKEIRRAPKSLPLL